jgi:uncharacterized protein YceK
MSRASVGKVSSAVLLIGAGALLTRHGAGRQIGLLLLGCGSVIALNLLAGGYAIAGTRQRWPGVGAAEWATTWLWALTVIPLPTVLPAVFPDGRALNRGELGLVAVTHRRAQRADGQFPLHAGPGETTVTATPSWEQS